MRDRVEQKMIEAAFAALNQRNRVLAPEDEAWIEYKNFDPCKATQLVAVVHWPALIGFRNVILKHNIDAV